MFKRIHSKRDPGDTLGSEIQKEFAVYFKNAGSLTQRLLERHPKYTLAAMALCILVSLVLSFTLFHQPANVTPSQHAPDRNGTIHPDAPVSDGLDQIMATTSALQQTLDVRKQVENLLAKPALTAADSGELEKALDRLSHLQKTINQRP